MVIYSNIKVINFLIPRQPDTTRYSVCSGRSLCNIFVGGGSITKNQIEYAKLLETQRTNRANEDIKSQGNQLTYALGRDTLAEQARSNRAREAYNRANLEEASRHNVAGEAIQRLLFGEQQRSNLVREALSSSQVQESVRSNLANEAISRSRASTENYRVQSDVALRGAAQEESARHNVVGEQLSQYDAMIREMNARNQQAALDETSRHNRVQEGLQNKEIYSNATGSAVRNFINGLGQIIRLK